MAVKVINKTKLEAEGKFIELEEINALTKLDHLNIVKYYETYSDEKYVYLLMEYC